MHNKHDRTDAEEAAASKISGVANRVKGSVKEAWGDLTNDPARQHEGARDRVKGRIQEEYSEIKDKESRIERDLDDVDKGVF